MDCTGHEVQPGPLFEWKLESRRGHYGDFLPQKGNLGHF
jgi:hypothetical protein